MSEEEEEGLCDNCGAFGRLYGGGLCEYCFDASIEEQNDYAYGEGEEEGVSLKDQHIDDAAPVGKGLGYFHENSIPFEYTGEPKKCMICWEEMKKGDTVISLPCCHQFHIKCIYEWLKNNDDCPLCRTSISNKK